jgi:hypothetical protein
LPRTPTVRFSRTDFLRDELHLTAPAVAALYRKEFNTAVGDEGNRCERAEVARSPPRGQLQRVLWIGASHGDRRGAGDELPAAAREGMEGERRGLAPVMGG